MVGRPLVFEVYPELAVVAFVYAAPPVVLVKEELDAVLFIDID